MQFVSPCYEYNKAKTLMPHKSNMLLHANNEGYRSKQARKTGNALKE